MEKILNIDNHLTSIFSDFETIANEIEMPIICFLSEEEKISSLNYPGLYRIDILTEGNGCDYKTWIELFSKEWKHENYLKKFTPNPKIKRIKCHDKLQEWMPLYLGKSKNVAHRVSSHIHLDLEIKTFALKLKARQNMDLTKLRLHSINLEVKNYDLIAPRLESALRNRINPILGKQ